jgi:hypothetical protein
MNKTIIDTIRSYANSQSRNKIVFHRNEIPDITTIDLGLNLATSIYNFQETGKVSMMVTAELSKILSSAVRQHQEFGKYLSVENTGILFEQALKIDFRRFLDNYSQNNLLFVKWEGEIDADNIYFLTKENGININIQNLSHIVL